MRGGTWLWIAQIYDVSLTCFAIMWLRLISRDGGVADWIADRSGKVIAKCNSECIIEGEFLKFKLHIFYATIVYITIRCLSGECAMEAKQATCKKHFLEQSLVSFSLSAREMLERARMTLNHIELVKHVFRAFGISTIFNLRCSGADKNKWFMLRHRPIPDVDSDESKCKMWLSFKLITNRNKNLSLKN